MLKSGKMLAILALASCAVAVPSYAGNFIIKHDIQSNKSPSHPVYDENGFDESGIHKDTGTIYDPDGYGVLGCDYKPPETYWSDYGGYSSNGLVVVYNGSHQGYRGGHQTSFLAGKYRYVRGAHKGTSGSMHYFVACRQVVKP